MGGTIHENYTYPHRSGKNGDLPSTGINGFHIKFQLRSILMSFIKNFNNFRKL